MEVICQTLPNPDLPEVLGDKWFRLLLRRQFGRSTGVESALSQAENSATSPTPQGGSTNG